MRNGSPLAGIAARIAEWRKRGADRRGTASRARAQFNLRGRLTLVAAGLGLCAVALVARAVQLQLIDREFYQQRGDARFLREIRIPATRGMITDRNGEPLAVSTPAESIGVNPQELLNAPKDLARLAAALGMSPDTLARKLGERSGREFVFLKRRINPAEARRILALGIPGVSSQREYRRFYPQGEAIAHILGFTNIDDRGQEGLELEYDEELAGTPGLKRVIRDRFGRVVEEVDLIRPAEPGRNLTLSIDRRIQYLAYRELKRTLTDSGAVAGSAVVLDVATGEVLAMVNLPSFNPNAVSGGNRDAHRNRAITDMMEPGSTIKPLTVAMGLEKGVITLNSRFDTNPGWIPNGRYRTNDTHNYGVLDTTGVITKSSNVASAMISHRVSNQDFYDFYSRMGYGRRTGIRFPGESPGAFAPPARWSGTDKQTMSYGYGLTATALQIAHVYAALGNGGRAMPPTFIKGETGEPTQLIDEAIARNVVRMMQTVTEPGGTATQAAILGYHVAGKTGTARKSYQGGYSRRYLALFAGLVPATNPRFAMVVVVDDPDPARGYYGGVVSAPVFKNVMDGALRLMDVPPDDIDTWIAAQQRQQPKAVAVAPLAQAPSPVVTASVAARPQPARPQPPRAQPVAPRAAPPRAPALPQAIDGGAP